MKRIHLFEYLLYATVLLVALCIPFFNGLFEYRGWSEVWKNGLRTLPFLLIFLMNNHLLVPKLLFSDRHLHYLLSCLLLVAVVVFLFEYFLSDFIRPVRPDEMGGGIPLDGSFPRGNMPNADEVPFPRRGVSPRAVFPPPHPDTPHFFNFGMALVSLLLTGFNTGVKSFVRHSEERERQSERERQFLNTELAFLKHQISPHFFMNTLNNIHSLIDIDTEKARDAVIKLSRLMRYMLYETDAQKVSLKKEIEFIESYIELMRMRYDDDMLTIETEFPAVTNNIYVPSFLFLSFIENAFKHGVDLHEHSLICLWFAHENGRLTFTVRNRKSGKVYSIIEKSGIGLENVRKRLDLIFKDNYTLRIQPDDVIYEVNLNIPV